MLDLLELRKKLHRSIYVSQVGEYQVAYHLLEWGDFCIYVKALGLGLVSTDDVYRTVFQECVVDPVLHEKMDQLPAGVIATTGEFILRLSGNKLMTDQDGEAFNQEVGEARDSFEGNLVDQFFALICRAFPSLTPMQLDRLEYKEILRLLVMAEKILGLEKPILLEKKSNKKKTQLEKFFADAKSAEQADQAPPDGVTATRRPRPNAPTHLPPGEVARQEEAIRIARERKREADKTGKSVVPRRRKK